MNILVTLPVQSTHKELLENAYPGAAFRYHTASELTREDAVWAEVCIGNLPPKYLPDAVNLKWLQLNSAGADAYLGNLPSGTLLTNATGAYGLAISEHLLAMLLGIQKKLHLYRVNQIHHNWHDEGNVTSIEGARALVVGAGNIGGDFARKLHALGAEVYGIRRTAKVRDPWLTGLYHMDKLDELLPEMDIVALCLPGTPETKGLFDAERLAKMKRGAILLNVGRGTAIDSDALCDALMSGHLGGAGLDVTEPEPLPVNHPLWDAPNCIITPHVSGFYHLPETFERIVRIAADNLTRYREGRTLVNLVDERTGYRTLRE